MGARHEQVRAYRFVTRRIVSAVLSGEPESNEFPLRRMAMALFGGLLVATIGLAVAGVLGFINPSGGTPAENDIIIMRESGARFVYVDGTLHPVLNYASALLIVDNPNPQVRTMSRKSLETLKVGKPVGIRDAPDPPPAAADLVGLPWNVCSSPPPPTSNDPATIIVEVGHEKPGGVLLGEQAVLVSTAPFGNNLPSYLLWNNHRLRITDPVVLTALGLTSIVPVRVADGLLNAITAGPDLAAVKIAGAGTTSKSGKLAGPIGQVYRSGQEFYVLTPSGLATIGSVTAALLTAKGAAPLKISPAQAAQAARTTTEPVEPRGFPRARPAVRDITDQTLCATIGADSPGDPASIGMFNDTTGSKKPDGNATIQDGVRTADQVILPVGRGALVRAQPAPGVAAATTVYLITDQGVRYPLLDSGTVDTQSALGYAGVEPVPIPAPLLSLIPKGPTLDPAAARAPPNS